MMHDEMLELIACQVCEKPPNLSTDKCHKSMGRNRPLCNEHDTCRIYEKSQEQLCYILSSPQQNLFVRACPGCGKTEVVGLKAAYEIKRWDNKPGGIAVLTFTNNATDVIRQRISQFTGLGKAGYPHFIGTIDSWLHSYIAHPFGYLLTGYKGKNGDHTIRIIDSGSTSHFLSSFQTKYQLNKTGNVFSNHFYFNLETDKFVFSSEDRILDSNRNLILLSDWQKDDLLNTKSSFLRAGFATYQDIEWLCHKILTTKPESANMMSRRFPFIIVDECQDLSWIQLQILEKLKSAGTVVHLVGDLNQAIYEFKQVNPQIINDFAVGHNFQNLFLNINYRSCQPIVNVCQKIVGINTIVGDCKQLMKHACLYKPFKKNEISNLVGWFENYLVQQSIDVKKSVVLTRSWKNVGRLRPAGNNDINSSQKRLAMAIHLWDKGNIQSVEDSLKYLGRFLAEKYFSRSSTNFRQFYCPDLVDSPLKWRIFLSKVLDACTQPEKSISNLNQTWASWVPVVRFEFGALLRSCSSVLENVLADKAFSFEDLNGNTFKVPSKLGDTQMANTLNTNKIQTSSIRVTTIHSVKGQTFDAVLLVSARDKTGTTDGYWTQWLQNPGSEAARLAYVASSRPQHLLVWALPDPTEDEQTQIRGLGFDILGIT